MKTIKKLAFRGAVLALVVGGLARLCHWFDQENLSDQEFYRALSAPETETVAKKTTEKKVAQPTPKKVKVEPIRVDLLVQAMALVETGGKPMKGASGESYSTLQWMPATWKAMSARYNREVRGQMGPLPLTLKNERLVAKWKCEQLAQHYTPRQIGIIWNASLGGAERPFVRRGVNRRGVRYDSGRHGDKVAATYYRLLAEAKKRKK